KNLRQLNFYFLLACVALLLAIYLPRDATLDKATTQLDEVIRFQSDVGDEQLYEIAGASPPAWSGHRDPYAAILFKRPSSNSPKQNVCFVYENEILKGQWMELGKVGLDDFRHVETHEEFSQLWNSLARDDAYLRIREYSPDAYYSPRGEPGIKADQQIPVQVVTNRIEVQQLFELAFSAAGTDKLTPTIAEWIVFDEEISGKRYAKGIQLARSMRMIGGDDAIVLPVAVEPAGLPILNRLFERTDTKFKYLSANDYDLVHRELSDWTLDGKLDQLGLYSMRSILDALRIAQSEKFDVFGFGVPYEFLFQYGLLILVAIEVFFWGHLRSFRILTAQHEPAVWAPWLPLYPNLLSRALTIVSVVIFPISVIIGLVLAGDLRISSVFTAAVGIAVAGMIFTEFYRHWHATVLTPVKIARPTAQAA
ncbi:MAG: hypothetical protein ACI9G1_005264, partial [Pirellulaceae bacterium]